MAPFLTLLSQLRPLDAVVMESANRAMGVLVLLIVAFAALQVRRMWAVTAKCALQEPLAILLQLPLAMFALLTPTTMEETAIAPLALLTTLAILDPAYALDALQVT